MNLHPFVKQTASNLKLAQFFFVSNHVEKILIIQKAELELLEKKYHE